MWYSQEHIKKTLDMYVNSDMKGQNGHHTIYFPTQQNNFHSMFFICMSDECHFPKHEYEN